MVELEHFVDMVSNVPGIPLPSVGLRYAAKRLLRISARPMNDLSHLVLSDRPPADERRLMDCDQRPHRLPGDPKRVPCDLESFDAAESVRFGFDLSGSYPLPSAILAVLPILRQNEYPPDHHTESCYWSRKLSPWQLSNQGPDLDGADLHVLGSY